MAKKTERNYRSLVRKRHSIDPLEYLFDRFNDLRADGRHEEAMEVARFLIPYGHGKRGRINAEGETITPATFVLE